jgi:DNA-binding NarL/FixJ family response regulator
MITVILADDHAILRDGLRFLLEAAGDIHILPRQPTVRKLWNKPQCIARMWW